jgi:putative nucleotidyltransferase with HDIG domain
LLPIEFNVATVRPYVVQAYVGGVLVLGAAALLSATLGWESHDPLRFFSFLAAAALASVFKVRVPGAMGMVSVLAIFLLVSIANLTLSEAMVLGSVAMLVQCTWDTQRRASPVQVAFHVCALAISVFVSSSLFQLVHGRLSQAAGLGLLAAAFYIANTLPNAAVVALRDRRGVLSVWTESRWMLGFYAAGWSMAWLVGILPQASQWELPLICLPLVYLALRANREHIEHVEQINRHMSEMNGLHLRTIEALACAIDAKDHNTHDHLQRVQFYALEIGKDLGLSELELDALRAAATLHDIGKLAVPESIISKPGKLTRAEFDKMKIHPVVGAEILERVDFPYPVAPIVRAHHERWDGNGYPYGLKGAEIPIGARILTAVDCLDALASDRQYRRAMPLDDAMARVALEAGRAFDPDVIRVLQNRYRELEAQARNIVSEPKTSLSVDMKIARGSAPAAGLESPADGPEFPVAGPEFKDSARAWNVTPIHPVARVRNAGANEISGNLSGREALAVAALRVEAVAGYDAIGFYSCQNGFLRPRYVAGDEQRALNSLVVAQGEGLIGWVAEAGQPILNGNPAVEPGYPATGGLASAMALPLRDGARMAGVMALYRKQTDAFAGEELVAVLNLCPSIAAILANPDDVPAEASTQIDTLEQLA